MTCYYTRYIQSRSDWEFAGIYTDEGISGLGTKNREGFNQMIADAMAGKIDLIITKSVSRFARNTVDTLVTIRKLKEKGIEVFFEKENIHSLDGRGELLLTIMSSLAQEESRSISQNVTWGQRKETCKTPALSEDEIKRRFLIAVNRVYDNRAAVIDTCNAVRKKLLDTSEIEKELSNIGQEMIVVQRLTADAVRTNSSNNEELKEASGKSETLSERHDRLVERKQQLEKEKAARKRKAAAVKRFESEIQQREQVITVFDKLLWMVSLSLAVVNRDGSIRFDFVNGEKITVY